MQYFANTLNACGSVAIALLLSACGEETDSLNNATQTLLDADVSISQSIADSINAQRSEANTAASAPAQSVVAEPTIRFSAPGMPEANPQATTAPTTTQLANGDTVLLARAPSVRAPQGQTPIAQPQRNFNDQRPVQPQQPAESDGASPEAGTVEALPPVIGGDPMVSLVAKTDSELNSSGTKLVWNTQNVDSCEASGAWDGALGTNGELKLQHEEAGELTFMISCRGTEGVAMAMVTVDVANTVLAWQPPAKNTDGSPVTDLAGYNLYYGTEPGRYTEVRPVRDASQTNLELPVEPGTYYLAMTAYDLSGNESGLSNEIVRIIN